jgi:hypothetical protein
MWEVGFAMALACPTIIVTQKLADLPFDIRDMQSIEYDRNRISFTLSQPLQRMVVDTLSTKNSPQLAKQGEKELVGELLEQIADLKSMVAQAVRSWNSPGTLGANANSVRNDLIGLEGAWINKKIGSHMYARVIGNDLIAPYCYMGNNKLTGTYFGWRKSGPFWFARFAWLEADPAGFAFLKQESVDVLRGAWWNDTKGEANPIVPPTKAGVTVIWQRATVASFPKWAIQFLKNIENEGLPRKLSQTLKSDHSGRPLPG